MMAQLNPDNFDKEVTCIYRDEKYDVRDNGAVYRHRREGGRRRPLDEKWSFGRVDKSKGYTFIASEAVHRIVATAFIESQPSKDHVVDHIDTNKRNNRPENLRWVTRLENLLLNPITCYRIEQAYGSIENFLKDPSKPISGKLDQNFEWMREVTKEEAEYSSKRLTDWARNGNLPSGGSLGEWLYNPLISSYTEMEKFNNQIESNTPGAIQKNWKTPSEFPLCPINVDDYSLNQYLQKLKRGKVFAFNNHGKSVVHSADISESSQALFVVCNNPSGVKKWSLARITIEDQNFIHENMGSYFSLDGVMKRYTLGLGLEWEGGDSIDDFL